LSTNVGGATDASFGDASSTCAADDEASSTSAVDSTISSIPRRYGGAMRGNGARPSIFAEKIFGRSVDDIAHDVVEPTRVCELGDCSTDALDVAREGSLHTDEHLQRADRVRADQCTFQYAVRIAPEDLAILE
jgi:hypothetical protein